VSEEEDGPGAAPRDTTVDPNPPRGGFLRHVLPALVWTVALFFGGGGPTPADGPGDFIGVPSDKLLHAAAFLVLALLAARAVHYGFPNRPPLARIGLAVGLSVAIGVLLEVYQLALPDRSADVGDALADAIGALLGGAALVLFRSKSDERYRLQSKLSARSMSPPR
jgi:VanZ family protein